MCDAYWAVYDPSYLDLILSWLMDGLSSVTLEQTYHHELDDLGSWLLSPGLLCSPHSGSVGWALAFALPASLSFCFPVPWGAADSCCSVTPLPFKFLVLSQHRDPTV